MGLGFRSAERTHSAKCSSLPKFAICGLAICGLVLAGFGWYLAFAHDSLRSPGGKRELIAEASDSAPTLRAAAEKHHLLMGTAVDSHFLSRDAPYAATLSREYSALEPENEMKFDSIHPKAESYNFADADAQVAFAQAHSMRVRGHSLVCHLPLPDWISVKDWMHAQNGPSAAWTPEALNKILAEHIATVVGRYKGKIYAWDVVNEPFNEDGSLRSSIWYEKPGIGFGGEGTKYIEQALIWAHAADSEAKLFVNESGAENLNRKSDAVYAMAKDFLSRGVPLHGIGLQLHVESDFNSFDSLRRNIHRLADLGLEVHFTEVDVRLRDHSESSLRKEAGIYENLVDACLREPACTLFQTWGFTDRSSWIPEAFPEYGWALPFDANYRKKPAYDVMLKKLQSRDNVESRPKASRGVISTWFYRSNDAARKGEMRGMTAHRSYEVAFVAESRQVSSFREKATPFYQYF